MSNRTLQYYNDNSELFNKETVSVDFDEVQKRFTSFLHDGSTILDFGCGSGRDTKYFISKGFLVEATDGSEEMCKIASSNTGISVRNERFMDLDDIDDYDGIWACASILHLTKDELTEVFKKMSTALKKGGYLYTSFKKGTFEGYRGERYYTDFTEELFKAYFVQFEDMRIIDIWTSNDVRHGRDKEHWLNIIVKKI